MAGVTTTADINITVRELDLAARFVNDWKSLREIMGVTRPVRKAPGTAITTKYATVDLESGSVAEGEVIPISQSTVSERTYGTLSLKKYRKAVSLEAIDTYGFENAVQRTDDELLAELQSDVTGNFYSFLRTGTLTRGVTDFQMALAMAKGDVLNKWRTMHKSITEVVGFCNILDAYTYLGAANIHNVEKVVGIEYLKNFMGFDTLFLLSNNELPHGMVVATPAQNIINYYVSPSDSEFARADLRYTTSGETDMVGFHIGGDYTTATSQTFAIMGMALFAEYLDGIAVVTFGGSIGTITAASAGATNTTGATKITISAPATIPADWTIYAKALSSTAPAAPDYLAVLDTTGWTKITPVSGVADDVTGFTSGHKMRIVALNAAGQAVATSDSITVAVKA